MLNIKTTSEQYRYFMITCDEMLDHFNDLQKENASRDILQQQYSWIMSIMVSIGIYKRWIDENKGYLNQEIVDDFMKEFDRITTKFDNASTNF